MRRSLFLRPTSITLMMQGEAVRRRQNIEFQSNRPSDYDIDKEQWGKQMQFASLECVIDNNIQPYSMWSIAGIRKNISGWMTMKKLMERRPNFKKEDLLDTFANYKLACNSLDHEKFKLLSRMTTFAEAERLTKEGTSELHARMKSSSWKTIAAASSKNAKHKQQQKLKEKQEKLLKEKQEKQKTEASTSDETTATSEGKSTEKKQEAGASGENEILFSGIAGPNMAGVDPYEIQIVKFDIVNLWMGSMTAEDWIQLTAKVEYREKNASIGPFANKMSLPQSSSAAAEALRMKTIHGNANTDKDGFTKITEYPVFEVKLGDGITAANTQPFSIVCILDKDGSRYGKDGNDVSLLRKNFAQTSKSKWGFGR